MTIVRPAAALDERAPAGPAVKDHVTLLESGTAQSTTETTVDVSPPSKLSFGAVGATAVGDSGAWSALHPSPNALRATLDRSTREKRFIVETSGGALALTIARMSRLVIYARLVSRGKKESMRRPTMLVMFRTRVVIFVTPLTSRARDRPF